MFCHFKSVHLWCDLRICKSVVGSRLISTSTLSHSQYRLPERTRILSSGAQILVRAGPSQSVRTRVSMATAGETFFLDEFAVRQWDDPNYSGTRISFSKTDFIERIHEFHSKARLHHLFPGS